MTHPCVSVAASSKYVEHYFDITYGMVFINAMNYMLCGLLIQVIVINWKLNSVTSRKEQQLPVFYETKFMVN
jgi:hypothetical protein